VLLSVLVFSLGLVADQMKQILVKIQYRNPDGHMVRGNMVIRDERRVGNG
jgi:hypothetical protein